MACPFAAMLTASKQTVNGQSGRIDLAELHSALQGLNSPALYAHIDAMSRTISLPQIHGASPAALGDGIQSLPRPASSSSSSSSSSDASAATSIPTSASSRTASAPLSQLEPPATGAPIIAEQRMTRRQLRKLGRSFTLQEVRQHAAKDDAWIAVDGRVYDITEHLVNHPGWHDNAAISTVLSILAHTGTDCSEEFREIHRPYPVAWRQLAAYYIGDLEGAGATASSLTASASVAQLGALAGGGGGTNRGMSHSQSAPALDAAARGGQPGAVAAKQ
ncbi:hypothetical protein HXX76_011217 [Chlamydomonas incerta]|uniref:Cytochrome b5 heme-binding domain-containing protein n=1 Tax=Chlamydomonas incerta TaxID=51695 RepID=A0A835SSR0_CHLIN|nr:hypothetical protein HXX76_011217 [Chlamydomonas incerta]|eukprot:KAG2428973.1 hypothetical protein HXX76_011217 [Chlamydomonas incerta]